MMSNRLYEYLLILFSILVMSLGTASSWSSAEQNFTFQKKSFSVDESKLAHVFGEIKNTSNKPVTDIIVQASFYDSHHTLLNKFKRSTDIRTLNPGDITPFEILYYDFKTVDLRSATPCLQVERIQKSSLKLCILNRITRGLTY